MGEEGVWEKCELRVMSQGVGALKMMMELMWVNNEPEEGDLMQASENCKVKDP